MHLCVCLLLVVLMVLMVGRGDRNQAEKKKTKHQLMAAVGSHFHGVLGVKVGAVVLAETEGEMCQVKLYSTAVCNLGFSFLVCLFLPRCEQRLVE